MKEKLLFFPDITGIVAARPPTYTTLTFNISLKIILLLRTIFYP